MPIFHHLQSLFVHIPKTAGTSIGQALGLRMCWPDVDMVRIFGPYDGQQLQHLTCTQLLDYGFLDVDRFNHYFKFAFVRNPYDRLVSEYYFDTRWNDKTKGMTFRDFVEFISEQLSGPRVPAHYRPQSDFVGDEAGRTLVDFIGRYESLPSDWLLVCKFLGVSGLTLGRKNEGHHGPYLEHYDAELISMVNAVYASDFKRFGYAML